MPQFNLFSQSPDQPANPSLKKERAECQHRFIAPTATDITFGNVRLENYLEQAALHSPVIVGKMLDQQDWSTFEARYAKSGRPPYAPRNMMGLILYGIMQGVTSLRALEKLARLDLGCMWVSDGISICLEQNKCQ